jgi:hypothetical protein
LAEAEVKAAEKKKHEEQVHNRQQPTAKGAADRYTKNPEQQVFQK